MNKQKIGNIAFDIILCFICIGFIIGFINFSLKGEPLNIWGIKPMVILSGSMEPEIDLNSLVVTYKTENIKKGDIIMFQTRTKDYVVHRYYDDNDDGSIITKGDSNEIADYDPVDKNQVFGKVIIRMNFMAPYITFFKNLIH
ncbi:MAG: signal peptidase I [Lachnospiraceae bacterium]|nr:signal peptidase I [Lachnospiraceae bacterium]